MSLVLDFLRSKNFTAAEAALRAQLEQEVLSGGAPDAADRGLPGTTMSHLESLLLEPVPAAASGRYTSAVPPDSAPTKHARHSPPVAPPVAQAPVTFYESALNPGDDEWKDEGNTANIYDANANAAYGGSQSGGGYNSNAGYNSGNGGGGGYYEENQW